MTQIGGLFDLSGRVAIVTGATGVLGGAMARGLAAAGARVGILGRREERAKNVAEEIVDSGAEALALPADVLEREQLEGVREAILERWGRVDILVNAAGGNVPEATVADDAEVFGVPEDALRRVIDLNLMGTCCPARSSARRWPDQVRAPSLTSPRWRRSGRSRALLATRPPRLR
jgi:NAD(P)-dependent dehydrogenase (short-subunit alcohol dehydrogenase family)